MALAVCGINLTEENTDFDLDDHAEGKKLLRRLVRITACLAVSLGGACMSRHLPHHEILPSKLESVNSCISRAPYSAVSSFSR